MVATVAAIAATADYAVGMNFFIDVTKMDYAEASFANIFPNRAKWEMLAQSTGEIKIAFVDTTGKNFGTGRQSEILLSNDQIERRPFKTAKEALAWLEIGADYDTAAQFTQNVADGAAEP